MGYSLQPSGHGFPVMNAYQIRQLELQHGNLAARLTNSQQAGTGVASWKVVEVDPFALAVVSQRCQNCEVMGY